MTSEKRTLSQGQIEVRRIIDSFSSEYESLPKKGAEYEEKFLILCTKVLIAFCSNATIVNDAVTSQRLGASQYSENYLDWLRETGRIEEIRDISHSDFQDIDFSMCEIVYRPDGNLQPAYKGGVKYDSTIWSLFQLAQERLLPIGSWHSEYYDAIDLWKEGAGGHHRLLAHILYGSDKINPSRVTIIRNGFVDPALNEALLQFKELSIAVNSNPSPSRKLLDFDARLISSEELRKIKAFFPSLEEDEGAVIVKCLRAIRSFREEYILNHAEVANQKITIDGMYRLLEKLRMIRSRPFWYRSLLVVKQRLFGWRIVDIVSCIVLNLATNENPYYADSRLNQMGLLSRWPMLRRNLLGIVQ